MRYELGVPEFENSMTMVGEGRVLSDNSDSTYFLLEPNGTDNLGVMQIPILGLPHTHVDVVYSVKVWLRVQSNFAAGDDPTGEYGGGLLDVSIREYSNEAFLNPLHVRAMYNWDDDPLDSIPKWIGYDMAPWDQHFSLDESMRFATNSQRTLCVYARQVRLFEGYVEVNGGATFGGWGGGSWHVVEANK